MKLDYSKRYLNTELYMKMRFEGYWGNDNLGENSASAPMFFDSLYTSFYFSERSFIRIGRQDYSIGSSIHDYFFDYIIDGALIKFESRALDRPWDISIMSDITGMATLADETRRFKHINKDPEVMEDFNGDTLSARFGFNASFWFARTFVYYVRYGASKAGGADISHNGLSTVNKPDGDYLVMGGGRLYYDFNKFGYTDLTYAASTGYDFQYSTNIKYQGQAVVFNYRTDIIKIADLSERIVKSVLTGISVGYFSDGFCGMRGASFGDSLLDEYGGYTPAPYAGAYHFYDYSKIKDGETFVDRSIAKTFYRFTLSTLFRAGVEAAFDYIRLYANESEKTNILMGYLYSGSLSYIHENVTFKTGIGVFMPDSYYPSRSAENSFIPAGKDPFTVLTFSFTSKFSLTE
jgi:hypothetical protein